MQCVSAVHIISLRKEILDYDYFRIVCDVAGSQPITIKWENNATNADVLTYTDVVIARLHERAYFKCIARNEFGYQEQNISIGKSKHIAIQLLTVSPLTHYSSNSTHQTSRHCLALW